MADYGLGHGSGPARLSSKLSRALAGGESYSHPDFPRSLCPSARSPPRPPRPLHPRPGVRQALCRGCQGNPDSDWLPRHVHKRVHRDPGLSAHQGPGLPSCLL